MDPMGMVVEQKNITTSSTDINSILMLILYYIIPEVLMRKLYISVGPIQNRYSDILCGFHNHHYYPLVPLPPRIVGFLSFAWLVNTIDQPVLVPVSHVFCTSGRLATGPLFHDLRLFHVWELLLGWTVVIFPDALHTGQAAGTRCDFTAGFLSFSNLARCAGDSDSGLLRFAAYAGELAFICNWKPGVQVNHLGVKPLRRPNYILCSLSICDPGPILTTPGQGGHWGGWLRFGESGPYAPWCWAGIFTNIYLNNGPNVGKYSSTMEHGELVQAHTSWFLFCKVIVVLRYSREEVIRSKFAKRKI